MLFFGGSFGAPVNDPSAGRVCEPAGERIPPKLGHASRDSTYGDSGYGSVCHGQTTASLQEATD